MARDSLLVPFVNGEAALAGCVSVLEVDPDLGEGLSPEEFGKASRCCIGEVLPLRTGWIDPWSVLLGAKSEPLGLLMLSGLVSRRLTVEGRHAVELIGAGDFLYASAVSPDDGLATETSSKVLEPAVLAVLDRSFWQAAARYPALVAALVQRSVHRSRSLMVRLALAEVRQVPTRVHLVLWHLADRWGRIAPGGVLLPLRLSRTTLAYLVCARRESVSRALSTLAAEDLVRAHERGFFLTGDSPAQRRVVLDLAAASEPARVKSVT